MYHKMKLSRNDFQGLPCVKDFLKGKWIFFKSIIRRILLCISFLHKKVKLLHNDFQNFSGSNDLKKSNYSLYVFISWAFFLSPLCTTKSNCKDMYWV